MSWNGFWIMAIAPDAQVRQWQERFGGALAETAGAQDEFVAWWATAEEDSFLERCGDRWSLTEAGQRFADLTFGMDDEEMSHEVMRAAEAAGESGRFVQSIRKGGPATALYYALGPAAAALLPGRFGEFLLTADGVKLALPDVELVLGLAGARRDEVIERLGRWIEGAADEPRFGLASLLDGPLGVFRRAAAAGLGLVGASLCF